MVTTSSTTRILSPGETEKPRRKTIAPFCRSVQINLAPKSARNLVAYNDAANRGRGDRLNIFSLKMFGDAPPKLFGVARLLQHQRTLQIDRTVQSAGKNKVSFEQRSSFSKLSQLLLPAANS